MDIGPMSFVLPTLSPGAMKRFITGSLLFLVSVSTASAQTADISAAAPDSLASPRVAEEREYFFYKRYGYGSDQLTNPFRLILNGGFGIIKLENRSNRPEDIDYANGWENVWHNLLNPIEAIEAKGWWDFISSEIIPITGPTTGTTSWEGDSATA